MRSVRRASVTIESGSRWFAGHFEGRPILPGIAHLAIVREALRTMPGAPTDIGAIEGLRFRRVVVPGETLDLVVGESAEDRSVRFTLTCGGKPVSGGRVMPLLPGGREPHAADAGGLSSISEGHAGNPDAPAVGAGDPVSGVNAGNVGSFPETPAPVDLIPHRLPMLMLEEIVRATDDSLVAIARIPHDSAYAEAGYTPGFVALELAAQAAAACEAIRRRGAASEGGEDGRGTTPIGYLVGSHRARLHAVLPVGKPVNVSIGMTGRAMPLCTYEFGVRRGGSVLAEGSISTWIQI